MKKVQDFGVFLKASGIGVITSIHQSEKGNTILYCRSLFKKEKNVVTAAFRVLLKNCNKTFKIGDIVSASGALIVALDNFQGYNYIIKTIFIDGNNKYSNVEAVEPSSEMNGLINEWETINK